MRHRIAGVKLGRTPAHRRALFRNLVTALLEHGTVRTTDAKAKELRRWGDRMITLGKQNTLHARRRAATVIQRRSVLKKLFDELAPRFDGRQGGYTRVVKLGMRHGDPRRSRSSSWSSRRARRPKRRRPRSHSGAAIKE